MTSGGSYDIMKMWMGLAPKNKRIPAIYHLCVDRFAYAECCAGITVSDASKYLSRGSLLSMEEKNEKTPVLQYCFSHACDMPNGMYAVGCYAAR